MTDFECTAYARWLDEGGADPPIAARAAAHAAACDACAAEGAVVALLRGSRSVDLGAPDFADRVMAHVALTPQDAVAMPAGARVLVDVLPWWIRATAQPASVLALGLAALVSAFLPQWLGASRDAPQWSAAALTVFTGALGAIAGSDPLAAAAVALALLPLVVVASLGFYRLGAALTTARFAPPHAGRRA